MGFSMSEQKIEGMEEEHRRLSEEIDQLLVEIAVAEKEDEAAFERLKKLQAERDDLDSEDS